MRTDLVFPVRLRQTTQQRYAGESLDDFELGLGKLAALAGFHEFRFAGPPANFGINRENILVRCAVNEAEKLTTLLIGPEQVSSLLACFVGFTKQCNPTGFEIQAVCKTKVAEFELFYSTRLGINGVTD